ncbi:hypothetical protein BLA15816_06043 [Burkholderia lata]|uniref:Uncharacterized protein n=1 Tax=Burkholderia lata (strain ATCC 17760 / DSM 23089 / LMG 22485 / NCIMB 9086 / R18194 / 383) TaxID=482957 RepID=A0A6P2QDU4_BURL3|nr:hypothetical protein BLA15945_05720 [Burkholderia lata]VWC23807.1 hypothetical protein BLA15816_06043 [Burkholderia lata]
MLLYYTHGHNLRRLSFRWWIKKLNAETHAHRDVELKLRFFG